MSTAYQEDISTYVLRRMKEGGFDFARIHPIEFYAVFPDEERARQAAGKFRGESLNTQINAREDGAWHLQLSKLMYATYDGIGDFEHDFQSAILGFDGEVEGWGVKQEIKRLH
ncbi:ribonuclease E inhibitor RraB [Pseudomonas sp. LP_7_YM]|uniref:ribonuclease E inhibitor RraB n=1 Tax=Pseudomonas sp. LP_7_YM TaxID=2485137 RepID=UPI001061C581|nr:ribonuclease E inhibitor RraB [Pseudomonas sp. LP_7_YM]TDV71953.1 regulator of ribonuclease activity B [Pseudomonas sp. LP_7_YM]